MAYFYGYLTGNRGIATRCGSRDSGITAHIRSWNNDVYVSLGAGGDGKDKLHLTIPKKLKENTTIHWD